MRWRDRPCSRAGFRSISAGPARRWSGATSCERSMSRPQAKITGEKIATLAAQAPRKLVDVRQLELLGRCLQGQAGKTLTALFCVAYTGNLPNFLSLKFPERDFPYFMGTRRESRVLDDSSKQVSKQSPEEGFPSTSEDGCST